MQKRNFLKALGSVTFAALASGAGLSARASDARAPRILFVYVTRTGHTESIGKAVRHQLGDAARVDFLRVRTVEPYPSEYKPMTKVVKAEREQGIERKITAPVVNLKDYDVVILALRPDGTMSRSPWRPGSRARLLTGSRFLRATRTGAADLCIPAKTSRRFWPSKTSGSERN